ncbi:hypothetical protein OG217_37085 (plasmid) [Streptomyces sp. NBC_01023]|uniref:hypothetical protein n=1 Tax=unclassified Streptomyces TaxID=2593676 RepID=UPI002F90FDF4|nr:hypothetical protein OG217_37085 [Streptomyces sp. NBC_01023]
MSTRTAATVAATTFVLTAALTACGDSDHASTEPEAAPKAPVSKVSPKVPSVDCSDTSLSQADWVEHCSGKAGADTGGDGGPSTGLAFGKTYTWPDGLKVTVVEAKTFTDFTADEGGPDPKNTEFRVKLKLTNNGKQLADLGDIDTIIEGATNGGEAASTGFDNGAAPLEGRLAPGVSTVKTDDNALEKQYGKKIVIRVQRSSNDDTDDSFTFPEFIGTIR